MPMRPDEFIAMLLQGGYRGDEQGYGSSRMPMYHPDLLVPPGSIPRGEAESPPQHMTPDELEEYENATPGGGSPYSRPLPGLSQDLEGELMDIDQTRRQRQQEAIDQMLQNYEGY